jgi:hypothetical protein
VFLGADLDADAGPDPRLEVVPFEMHQRLPVDRLERQIRAMARVDQVHRGRPAPA